MTLFENKAVENILDELKTYCREKQFTSKVSPRLSFICGEQILDDNGNIYPGNKLKNENNIRWKIINKLKDKNYILAGNKKNKVLCVISEALYSESDDLLTFEEVLADLSDDIVIVVESAGTFCELGAFSSGERYIDKLIIINEDKDEHKDSFITKGPIKKIQKRNSKKVISHAGKQYIDKNLGFKHAMEDLSSKPVKISPNLDSNNLDPKMLMYELTCLIELFQPIEEYEVEYVYRYIKEFESYNIKNRNRNNFSSIKSLLQQMIELKMICKENAYLYINDSISCYDVMFTFSRKKFNDFRAKYMSVVYKKEPFRRRRGVQDELSG